MNEQDKKEILESESFDKFCFNVNDCNECIMLLTSNRRECADAYYAVKMEAEKAKVEKLKKCLFNTLQDVSNNDLLDEISSTLKEIEG